MIGSADQDLSAFRAYVGAWLEENFPKALSDDVEAQYEKARLSGPLTGDFGEWRRRMADQGWTAPSWPQRYGGGELSSEQALALEEEMTARGAVFPVAGIGISMLGPTLLEFGDEAQKAEHIPPIVRGERRWCQGFSEPNAGSDLASLQTRAEDMGDHFLVNGQKIWTSGANLADWCFCIVRTDRSRKHAGISFLLIDMASPGIEVRPIELISGESPFCETFLTDVKVGKESLIGAPNGGWTIAKRLLEFERRSIGNRQHEGRSSLERPRTIHEVAIEYIGLDESGRLADADLRARIAQHEMDERAVYLSRRRLAAQIDAGQDTSALASIMKNASMGVGQDRAELLVEILGSRGLGWQGDSFKATELQASRDLLYSKAFSIYGGTEEIQNNIIAKRVLGLPDASSGR